MGQLGWCLHTSGKMLVPLHRWRLKGCWVQQLVRNVDRGEERVDLLAVHHSPILSQDILDRAKEAKANPLEGLIAAC